MNEESPGEFTLCIERCWRYFTAEVNGKNSTEIDGSTITDSRAWLDMRKGSVSHSCFRNLHPFHSQKYKVSQPKEILPILECGLSGFAKDAWTAYRKKAIIFYWTQSFCLNRCMFMNSTGCLTVFWSTWSWKKTPLNYRFVVVSLFAHCLEPLLGTSSTLGLFGAKGFPATLS